MMDRGRGTRKESSQNAELCPLWTRKPKAITKRKSSVVFQRSPDKRIHEEAMD
jgi:hypothetical protein